MTEFEAEAGIQIPQRELRGAREEIEDSLGSVSVSVDADGPSAVTDGGTGASTLAGGASVLEELDDQTEVLRDIHEELEKIGMSGGSGDGGGGLFGGASGVAIGSLLAGGSGGILGTVLGKGKSGLKGLSAKRLLGRSPFTMLSQTAGRRDVAGRVGEDPSGLVTGTLSDLGTGEFTLQEDFWPDIQPPDDLWPNLSPPDDLFPSIQPPDNLWPDIQAPDGLWPDLNAPSDGFWSVLNPNSGGESTDPGMQDPSGSFSVTPGSFQVNEDFQGQQIENPHEDTGVPDYVSNLSAAEKQDLAMQLNDPSNMGGSQDLSQRQAQRVDVVVENVTASIEGGRSLEDALNRQLQDLTPELKQAVLTELKKDMQTSP